jgi:hypothetical protein
MYVKDYNDDYKNYKKYNDEHNIYNKEFNTNNYSNEYSENYKIKSNEAVYDLNKSVSIKFFESYNYIINNFTTNDFNKIINELDIYLIPNDIITILVFYVIIFLIKKE